LHSVLALWESGRCIGRRRGWQPRQSRRREETLAVLSPYTATGVETCGAVRADRSTAREFSEKNLSLATFHWRKNGLLSAASALDHGYRSGERDERYSGSPQELRREIRAHQWNI
jgi:hypothetical protein